MSKKKLFALVLGACLLVSGTTYALSSSDFATIANTWVSANCNNASTKYKQRATICYLFHKSSEQNNRISTLESKSKQVIVYDKNGVKLGLLVKPWGYPNPTDDGAELFNQESAKLLSIGHNGYVGGNSFNVVFDGDNCTGTAYFLTNNDSNTLNSANDRLLSGSNSKFYTYNSDNSQVTVNLKSIFQSGSCQVYVDIRPAVKLDEISVSLPTSAALPLDYRYE